MNRCARSRYATALAIVRTTSLAPDLDDPIELAFRGNRPALAVVTQELRGRLLMEVIAVLGERFEQDADDVVDDVFLALLERRAPSFVHDDHSRSATARLRHMARVMAGQHLEHARERWNVDPDEGSPTE